MHRRYARITHRYTYLRFSLLVTPSAKRDRRKRSARDLDIISQTKYLTSRQNRENKELIFTSCLCRFPRSKKKIKINKSHISIALGGCVASDLRARNTAERWYEVSVRNTRNFPGIFTHSHYHLRIPPLLWRAESNVRGNVKNVIT